MGHFLQRVWQRDNIGHKERHPTRRDPHLAMATTASGVASSSRALLNVFVGCLSVYALLFGVGYIVYGRLAPGAIFLLAGLVGIGFLVNNLRQGEG